MLPVPLKKMLPNVVKAVLIDFPVVVAFMTMVYPPLPKEAVEDAVKLPPIVVFPPAV